ncbi:MAG: L-rhamnose isomerase, partial [Victivallales bacterium]|nr:L-rhamnose isomerase [Victivallales bacterium]
LLNFENDGDGAMKLALLEELKTAPVGDVWNMFCLQQGVPAGSAWIDELIDFDRKVVKTR